jgi:hypothetical protein
VEYSRPEVGLEDRESEWSGESWSVGSGQNGVLFMLDDKKEDRTKRPAVNRDVVVSCPRRCSCVKLM